MRRPGIRLESFWFAHRLPLPSLFRPANPKMLSWQKIQRRSYPALLTRIYVSKCHDGSDPMSPVQPSAPRRRIAPSQRPHADSESTRQRCPPRMTDEESTGELVNVSTAAVKSGVLSERDVWASKCIKWSRWDESQLALCFLWPCWELLLLSR